LGGHAGRSPARGVVLSRSAPLGVAFGSATPPNVASLLGGESSVSRRLAWRRGGSPPCRFAPGGESSVSAGSPVGRLVPRRSLVLGGERFFLSPLGRRPFGGTRRAEPGEGGGLVPVGPPRRRLRLRHSPQRRFAPGGREFCFRGLACGEAGPPKVACPGGREVLSVPPRPEAVWGDTPGGARRGGPSCPGRPPSASPSAPPLPPTSLRSWGERVLFPGARLWGGWSPEGRLSWGERGSFCPPSAGGRLGGHAGRSPARGAVRIPRRPVRSVASPDVRGSKHRR
jgi:hypothetical protein